MRRNIEIKHVGPRDHVRDLIDELLNRIEGKLQHFSEDAVMCHVMFEENGTGKLYRADLSCHTPAFTVAAHEEGRDPGALIRKAFTEVERQVDKQNAKLRHDHEWKKHVRNN